MYTLTNFGDILHRSSLVYRNRPMEIIIVYCNYISLTEGFLQQMGIIKVTSHKKSMEVLHLSGLWEKKSNASFLIK